MDKMEVARQKFVSTVDGKIEGVAAEVFDQGLRMVESGRPREEVEEFLLQALKGKDTSRGQSASNCAGECKGECAGYPAELGGWYACYAGCMAGCMLG